MINNGIILIKKQSIYLEAMMKKLKKNKIIKKNNLMHSFKIKKKMRIKKKRIL
jgi:hypothetical protein